MITAEPTVCDDIAILIIGCAAWMNRDLQRVADFLDAQLRAVLAAVPRVPRLDREARRRLAELANRIERARLEACARIVTVDTLRRWFRTLVARKWTHPRTGPGRPPIAPETEHLIVTMARENPGWGVRGISQRLHQLGIEVSRATVRRVLRRNGIDPAPMRTMDSTWHDFLGAHAAQIAAIDFTTVECFDRGQLITQYCLFAIHHDTRRVGLVGITQHPDTAWMAQQARNLTAADGFLAGRRFLIMDRDASFSERFRAILATGSVESVRTPPQSPYCNAFIERFFRSIKEECLSRIIPLSVDGLRHAIGQFIEPLP